MRTIIYNSCNKFSKHYLIDLLGKEIEVTEKEFNDIIGTDRDIIPMQYEKGNVNRQNFYINKKLIGYRTR